MLSLSPFHPLVIAVAVVLIGCRAGGEEPADTERSPGAPRLPVEVAIREMKLPPGFSVSLVAEEPAIRNPIACAWDDRGRLWIAENFSFAESPVRSDSRWNDRLKIVTLAGADRGSVKEFPIVVRDLTSVEVGRGGVWLMAPPRLLFVPDRDRDDQPDGPVETVLDGFTVPMANHHNFANGLRWGPDGWLYGRCGGSAPALVGRPGTPQPERVAVSGGLWRYHPETHVFEALCNGTTNPWGHDWDERGECFFINTVNGHFWHLIQGAHFTRLHTVDPNPYSYAQIDQHADHFHFDTGKGWVASRDGNANALGGGHAHVGGMVYLGTNWPDAFRGAFFTMNFHGRRVNQERIERMGAGFVARHVPDPILMADPWFRGNEITYGPDGAVYVLDWSDTGECHENTGVSRTTGRVYRIVHGEPSPPAAPLLQLASDKSEDLFTLALRGGEWFARRARERFASDPAARSWLRTHGVALAESVIRDTGSDEVAVLRALWLLHGAGVLQPDVLATAARSAHESIRVWSIRLALDSAPLDPQSPPYSFRQEPLPDALRSRLVAMARSDASGLVRLALASALQRLSLEDRVAVAEALVQRREDAADPNQPTLVWYGLIPLAEWAPNRLAELATLTTLPTTRRFIARRLAEEMQREVAPVEALLAHGVTFEVQPGWVEDILRGIADGTRGWLRAPKSRGWEAFSTRWGLEGSPAVKSLLGELSVLFGEGRAVADLVALIRDNRAETSVRRSALATLVATRPPELRSVCESVIGVRSLSATAAVGLALFDDDAAAAKLAGAYRQVPAADRNVVIGVLVSRVRLARQLIAEVRAGRIPKADVSAFHLRAMKALGDSALHTAVAEIWGQLRDSPAELAAEITRLKQALTPGILASARLGEGRRHFDQLCGACHQLFGVGGRIGPDLTGASRDNVDYLLQNIVDPSAAVTPDFQLQIVTLTDGRVITGFIRVRTPNTLTIQTMTGEVTVEQASIRNVVGTQTSLMPAGLLQALSLDQVRDLFAYLMSPTQVALP